jgi:hypothetical protein
MILRLGEAGINGAVLVRERTESKDFGNAEVVFQVGSLLLRFVRERGEDFLDLGSTARPEQFHQFDNVAIALGWATIDEVLAKREPESLSRVLARVRKYLGELQEALSGERERFTRAKIERAAHDRGDAFMRRLRGAGVPRRGVRGDLLIGAF